MTRVSHFKASIIDVTLEVHRYIVSLDKASRGSLYLFDLLDLSLGVR